MIWRCMAVATGLATLLFAQAGDGAIGRSGRRPDAGAEQSSAEQSSTE